MRKLVKERSRKAGLPPGSLVHIGDKRMEEARITVITYDEDEFDRKEIKDIDECIPVKERPGRNWIDVEGVHQAKTLERFGTCFGLHPLVLEDILNTDQRPKMEDYGDYTYIVLKMLSYDDEKAVIVSEQVSLILGGNFLISFQEGLKGDLFQQIRERIGNEQSRIRKAGIDYLAYSLLDVIIDHYFLILERLGERIEVLEADLIANPASKTLQAIQYLKREMLFLRKSTWPLREVVGSMVRGESSLIAEATRVYLRDVYDHTVQVIDTTEILRDMLSGMVDIYLSSVSNRLNAVMKVLTIIATIFMPLTFLAGVYGMNFKYMPELESVWGYPAVLMVMFLIAMSMVVYFKRKKWW